MGKMTVIGLC